MAAADFEHVFASWGFINALSHGATIIGTGMKYFSKASKAIIYLLVKEQNSISH